MCCCRQYSSSASFASLDMVELDESDCAESNSPQKAFSKEENDLPVWNRICLFMDELHELDELELDESDEVDSGSSPKLPWSDPYQCALSHVDNKMPLFTDELDELDLFELDEVKFVDPWWHALVNPSTMWMTWVDIFTRSKFFILNLRIVFFPKQSCTQPPLFGISHARPLHYADCMVISSCDSKSLVLLDCLGSNLFFIVRWPTTWIAFPETSSTSYTKHTSSNVPHYSTCYRVLQSKLLQVIMHDGTKCMGIIM